MKILIAEDDPTSLFALQMLLKDQGYEVTATDRGEAAWKAFQADRYPLVILDWMMPGMDGIDVCKNIRKIASAGSTCIIMITAKHEREDRTMAMSAGVDVFLNKPVKKDELVARLQIAERILKFERKAA